MSYASHPYWWLVCDTPGCTRISSQDSEYAAWAEKEEAAEEARDGDWVIADSLHFCPDHWRYVCLECGKAEGREYSRDHDGMCDDCWDGDDSVAVTR